MTFTQELIANYSLYKEQRISGRYIHLKHISPLLEMYTDTFKIDIVGNSVLEKPIQKLTIGHGKFKVLMWSQMHGNESTTTKAVFDMLSYLSKNKSFYEFITSNFTLCIIPMLNPDGAEAYTRLNSNEVDLNRDAQNRTQPESNVLRAVFNDFQPDFCFNLHDQRTIFSVANTHKPATVSFLTPAEDADRKVTNGRKKSMEVIAEMNKLLQRFIPGQVGRYDDGFNLNCIGDTFQSEGVPTILFESGHFPKDYEREETRKFIAFSIVSGLEYMASGEVTGENYESYFDIPENGKLFYDVVLRKFPIQEKSEIIFKDVAIFFKETLKNDKIEFMPTVEHVDESLEYIGHKELDMRNVEINPIPIHELTNGYLTDLLRKI
ncbi:M14 family metallopeptidase [Joostella sp. CR20]|uniref:M14 family metallopeptidase n=1 Tax=Joostella sp. CR20 TaxID=2804312 RepID=UPI00313C3294